jgi:trans-2,3-dihydro-3-hydroxyanthranilate isomerase
MSHSYQYSVVDVFTQEPLLGNGLAVFPDASGLDDNTMQRIAREMNLSETTFIGPPMRLDCAANVRIFTPAREMPFAGHPTIGSSFVLLETGMVAKDRKEFALEEKIGPVPVRVEVGEAGRPLIWLTTPPIRFGPTYQPGRCAEALGLNASELLGTPAEVVSAGNPGVFVAVKSKDSVDRAWFDSHGDRILKSEHAESAFMFVFAPTPYGAYSRMFAPEHGVAEDPATGSSTGPLAAYMMRHGLASAADGTRLVSEQGTKMGRRSILHILVHGEQGANGIEVGGYVTPVIEGVLTLAGPQSSEARQGSVARAK